MKTILKSFLLIVGIFFVWNFGLNEASAANNTFETAKEIKFEDLYTFEIDYKFTKSDKLPDGKYGKYYKFTLPAKAAFAVYVEGKNTQISLMSKNKKVLDTGKDLEDNDFGIEYENLAAGTYYLFLESEELEKISFYSLTFFQEIESNNKLSNATGIPNNAMFIGDAKDNSDIDYFKLTLKEYSLLEVFSEGKFREKVSILDAKGNKVKFVQGSEGIESYLSKGTYYIKVTPKKTSDNFYFFMNLVTKATQPIKASNVTVTNNYKKDDKITLKNLDPGSTYTIYKDSKKKTKITSFKAEGTSKTITKKQLGAKAGSVYITVKKPGYEVSPTTKVSYKGEPTSALSSKNVKITNTKTKDTIKFTGLKKDTTYVIYKDAKKKTKLTSFKATNTTKTVTVKQLGKNAGKIYITAQEPGYSVSSLTTVSYSKEK